MRFGQPHSSYEFSVLETPLFQLLNSDETGHRGLRRASRYLLLELQSADNDRGREAGKGGGGVNHPTELQWT